MTTINVGVVGCGYWGPNLIRNFRSLGNCRLKLICDISEDRLRHLRVLYPEVEGETNFQRFLARDGLDAVVIATAVKHHHRGVLGNILHGLRHPVEALKKFWALIISHPLEAVLVFLMLLLLGTPVYLGLRRRQLTRVLAST